MTEKKKSKWRNIIANAIAVLAVFLLAIIFPVNCFAEDYSAVVTLANDKNSDIYVEVTRHSGGKYDWQEYGYSIKNNVKSAIASGTPVFCTEFGVCDASGNGGYDFENADDWMKLFKKNNISYACWSLCNKVESASYLDSSSFKTSAWTANDLSETGVWLINTSRALAEDYNKNINANGQATFGFNAMKTAGQKIAITNVTVK